MKQIIFFLCLLMTSSLFAQKKIEKPASTGVSDVDQYVERSFEFWSTARRLDERVRTIDTEISSTKLSEAEVKSRKEELNNILKEAMSEQKKAEELTTLSSEMPEKAKAAVQGNPLKSARIMKNLAKAADAVKEGMEENMHCLKNIPALIEKIK